MVQTTESNLFPCNLGIILLIFSVNVEAQWTELDTS